MRLAGAQDGDHVIEVGPGLGALTGGLLEVGANVVAVEVDAGLVAALTAQFDDAKLQVIHHDALSVDWDEIADPQHQWSMIANLPYNVATPLVLDVLDDVPQVTSLLVMVQREVAERFAAKPGTAAYGIPSVKVAFWGKAEVVAKVPASVFLPQPRVESALVRIERYPEPRFDEPVQQVFELVRRAFNQRRKMLRKSLTGLVSAEHFVAAGIAEELRPEQLAVEDWCRLSAARKA